MTDNTSMGSAFALATGQDDETNLDAVAAYYFGQPMGKTEPLEMDAPIEVQRITKMGQYYSSLNIGNNPMDKWTVSSKITNGLPLFWMFGKATHTTPNTKQTITNFTNTEGRKPRIKLWSRDGDNTKMAYGACVSNLIWRFDEKGISQIYSGKACKHETVAYASNTPSAITHPGTKPAMFDRFDSLKWNNNSIPNMKFVEFKAAQELLTTLHETGGYYSDLDESTPIDIDVNIGFTANDVNLLADYDAKTKRTIVWKMLKPDGSGDYFEITLANSYCYLMTKLIARGEILGYTAHFTCENVSGVVQDTIADTFYTIPT